MQCVFYMYSVGLNDFGEFLKFVPHYTYMWEDVYGVSVVYPCRIECPGLGICTLFGVWSDLGITYKLE